MNRYEVLVVDDMMATREGLAAILRRIPKLELVKVCERSADALETVKHHHYDLAMLELRLGEDNGIMLGRQLIELDPKLKVIIYTKEATSIIAAEVFRQEYKTLSSRRRTISVTGSVPVINTDFTKLPSISNGLHGYILLKNITPYSLEQSLEILFQQGVVIDPEILDLLVERINQHRLTPRELECSEMISLGRSNREIAQHLGISQQAVENLINSLYNKLAITGEPKDPGRRVLLALTMQSWWGLTNHKLLNVAS